MRTMSYKLLREVLYHFEINHSELAVALEMSPTSLCARMTGRLPWNQDEMYLICNFVNSVAKGAGEEPPMPYERIHEIFPPRTQIPQAAKLKKGA